MPYLTVEQRREVYDCARELGEYIRSVGGSAEAARFLLEAEHLLDPPVDVLPAIWEETHSAAMAGFEAGLASRP